VIKNKHQLIRNGSDKISQKLRSNTCDIFETALKAVDPELAIYNTLRLENNVLQFKGGFIDLEEVNQIFLIGGGKAGGLMSKAVETLLGNRISSGIVNVLEGTQKSTSLSYIHLNGASHPVPSQEGVKGVQKMLDQTSNLNEDDLVITLISGGGSALMPLPAEGITLNDLQTITDKLLRAGVMINEFNAVRKHISGFKGGQLAKHCSPARVLSLILSDVIDDPIDTIASGPTAPDVSTFKDALEILEKYDLFKKAPEQVKRRIKAGVNGDLSETPKEDDPIFNRVHNVIIANNSIAAHAAEKKAMEMGYNSKVLTTSIEGEARKVGADLSKIAKGILNNNQPIDKPAAIIIGGETTVTVKGSGRGGRNQELAIGASLNLNCKSCLIATLGTDGIDGPTEAAGAIVDGASIKRAKKKGLDPVRYLDNNDSNTFFKLMGDAIITGPTGTNVNDLALILVV
jgi:glycerate-2-kinase